MITKDQNSKIDVGEKALTIISASRRTDIPAFHTDWFVNALIQRKLSYREPFSGAMRNVSLKPEEIHSIVFWSRDYSKLIPRLPCIKEMGYCFSFHLTITGHPRIFDRNVIDVEDAIEQAKTLARLSSPDHVFWRYDPLIISDITEGDHLIERFASLAQKLKGITNRCYLSFAQYYGKVKRNLQRLERETGIRCYDPPLEKKLSIAKRISEIAAENGMRVYSCCCDYLVGGRIEKAHCIDGDLLRQLFPERSLIGKGRPTRKGCGCFESRDIGTYNTCSHGCVYCYANTRLSP